MKFKITNKAIEWLKVEYEDGSWAQIPTVAGFNKNQWHEIIKNYAPKPRVEKLEDVPWNIGDEDTTEKDLTIPPTYSYEAARFFLYPSIEQQLLAMYESRKGNNVPLDNCDKQITNVDTLVPVDLDKTYTEVEVIAIRTKLIEEEA
ncbi:hypothetical protein [uncultured phage MedDCM-OCT-S05-C139]|nr:hypothetical protein [uncultured phage MedDCM-OCT-S05-C139]